MKKTSIRNWIAGKVRQQMLLSVLCAVGALFGGMLITFFTFWIIYVVIWIGFVSWLPLTHNGVLMAAAVIVGLLFVGNAMTDEGYLDKIELDIGSHRQLQVAVFRGSGYGWMLGFTSAKTARSTVKMLTTLLYTGPRMINATFRSLQRAMRLRSVDIAGCRRVVATALQAGQRVSFAAIIEKYPDLDAERVFAQLPMLDGVVYLSSDPPGLTLAPYLVEEIAAWKQRMRD